MTTGKFALPASQKESVTAGALITMNVFPNGTIINNGGLQ